MRTVVRYSVISWFSTSALWERTSTPCIESAIPAICETAFLAASDQLSLELPTKSSTLIWAMLDPPPLLPLNRHEHSYLSPTRLKLLGSLYVTSSHTYSRAI